MLADSEQIADSVMAHQYWPIFAAGGSCGRVMEDRGPDGRPIGSVDAVAGSIDL